MDSKSSKFHQRQEEHVVNDVRQQRGREFASVDEMLQQDIHEIEVPPAIAHRLADSVAKEPRIGRPWWRRWFS